jgi:hypothetical protein
VFAQYSCSTSSVFMIAVFINDCITSSMQIHPCHRVVRYYEISEVIEASLESPSSVLHL